MNKKFFIFVLAAAGVILLTSLFTSGSKNLREQEAITTDEIQTESALLVINYEDNNTSTYNLEVESDTTAFSLLKSITQQENIPIEAQQYDFGVFVKSINGFESTAEKAWIYFVNNESGMVAADQMKINPGDTVEWKYIPPSDE